MTSDILTAIHKALGNVITRPAGYGYLGKGDNSGVIVADINKRTLWVQSNASQPSVPVPLLDTINILPYIGDHPELEGVRVSLGYPPSRPNVLYITGLDQGEGLDSVKGITPAEQMLAAQKYVDVGSLINLRLSPNDPVDSEVYVNPATYLDASGTPATWGGDSTVSLLTAAIAALSAGEHQMAVVYVDSTGVLAIATNTAEAGGAGDKQVFDLTTITQDISYPDGAVLGGAVHLYYGQTLVTEDDIYRSADPRIVFKATGGSGMTAFTIESNTGDVINVVNATPLQIVGTGGIVANADDATKTVTIDGSGVSAPPFVDTTAIVKGSADPTKLLRFEVDGFTTATTRVMTLPNYNATLSPATTKGDISAFTGTDNARLAIGTIGQYFTPDTAASTGNKWDYATLDIAVTWGEDVSGSPNASVYQKTSDGKWYIANPVSSPPLISSRRGMILSTGASFGAINTAGVVRLRGPASGGSSLLANSPTYLLGAGTIGATPPTVTLDSTLIVVAMMGYALTTNSSYVQPYPTLTYRRYVTMSAGEEIDITHYSDITDKSRTARAFAIVYDSILAEDYASSNQDAVLQLKGQSGAGAATSADTAGGTNYGLGDVGGTETRQAQSFTLTAGQLSQVTFTLRANSGSPSVGITVSVRDDNAGIPATTSLYSSVVTTPTASAQNTVNISGGPFLAAGTYWLVLELSANQSTNVRYNMDGSASSVYAGGVSKADTVASLPFPGTWGTSNAGDLRTSITTSAVALYDNIAQGVSHTGTPNVVTSVKLWLRRVGSSSDNLTVSLCADSAGSPGSTITDGTSNAVVMSTLGTSFAYVEFTYSVGARPSLSSGVQYWIKLETTGSASNTVYVEVGTDNTSPSYANGQTKTDTGGTWSATSPASDSIFELYIQNDAFQEQLSIGQWSDPSTGQIGVRYGITFNNATDTQTSFKNNTDGTIIALLDVIMA